MQKGQQPQQGRRCPLAFGGKGQPPKEKKRQQTPKKKEQKPQFDRTPVLHEEHMPKEKNPVVPDMVYPVQQPVRKSFFDFPPGIGWI